MGITGPRKTEYRIDAEDAFREIMADLSDTMRSYISRLKEVGLDPDRCEKDVAVFHQASYQSLAGLSVSDLMKVIKNAALVVGSTGTLLVLAEKE